MSVQYRFMLVPHWVCIDPPRSHIDLYRSTSIPHRPWIGTYLIHVDAISVHIDPISIQVDPILILYRVIQTPCRPCMKSDRSHTDPHRLDIGPMSNLYRFISIWYRFISTPCRSYIGSYRSRVGAISQHVDLIAIQVLRFKVYIISFGRRELSATYFRSALGPISVLYQFTSAPCRSYIDAHRSHIDPMPIHVGPVSIRADPISVL